MRGPVSEPGSYVEDACDGAALVDGIGITLKPGENLSGALHRLGQRRRVWLVPDNAGLYQLTMITPGYDTRGNGEYVDTPQGVWRGGRGQHPADARRRGGGRPALRRGDDDGHGLPRPAGRAASWPWRWARRWKATGRRR